MRRVARSMICTVSESLAQMNSLLLSLDSKMPRGRMPTSNVSVTSSVFMSITEMVLSFSFDT